jgi:hypothetical protein
MCNLHSQHSNIWTTVAVFVCCWFSVPLSYMNVLFYCDNWSVNIISVFQIAGSTCILYYFSLSLRYSVSMGLSISYHNVGNTSFINSERNNTQAEFWLWESKGNREAGKLLATSASKVTSPCHVIKSGMVLFTDQWFNSLSTVYVPKYNKNWWLTMAVTASYCYSNKHTGTCLM